MKGTWVGWLVGWTGLHSISLQFLALLFWTVDIPSCDASWAGCSLRCIYRNWCIYMVKCWISFTFWWSRGFSVLSWPWRQWNWIRSNCQWYLHIATWSSWSPPFSTIDADREVQTSWYSTQLPEVEVEIYTLHLLVPLHPPCSLHPFKKTINTFIKTYQ